MSQTLKCISPVDGSLYCERPIASSSEIERTLSKAASSKIAWSKTTYADRAALCQAAVQHLVNSADEIGEELTWQMGRPIRYTSSEVSGGLHERANFLIEHGESFLSDYIIQQDHVGMRSIKHVPLGTVFVLAPWNYPFLTSVNVIIPALLAGNTVLLKHAEQTPLVAERYAQAFGSVGLPDGVFEYLHLSHAQVAKIIQDPRINHLSFTGSVGGGEAVLSAARNRFIDVGLELGGKDPAYICSDADLPKSIAGVVDGAFFNSGQSCCGIERIYVSDDVYEDFVAGCISTIHEYVLGDPTRQDVTLGPVIRPSAAQRIQTQIEDAISAGAHPLIDSSRFSEHNPARGYLAPQLLANANHQMELMTEETFGPVAGIMRVKDDEEAIQLMNDSRYGLTASIWTSDPGRASRIAAQLDCGTVFMNRCDYLDPALAWTGSKDSGRGVTLSELGMQALTRPKSLNFRY